MKMTVSISQQRQERTSLLLVVHMSFSLFLPCLFLYCTAVQAEPRHNNLYTTGGAINHCSNSVRMQRSNCNFQCATIPSLFISQYANKASFIKQKHALSYPTISSYTSLNPRQEATFQIHMLPNNPQKTQDTKTSQEPQQSKSSSPPTPTPTNKNKNTQEEQLQDLQQHLRKFRIRSTILENEIQKKE